MFEAIGNWCVELSMRTAQWWASHPVFAGVLITVCGIALLACGVYSAWYWHECNKREKLLREELKKMRF